MTDTYPFLHADQRVKFPPVEEGPGFDPICFGGNLSPGFLLSAYEQGLFPWYNPSDPLLWWSPDPRFVLYPEKIHIGKRLGRYIKNSGFEITVDKDFPLVMKLCGKVREKNTWIDNQMLEGYSNLHSLGVAHSIEVWDMDVLVGGLYGVRTGRVFSGESMFSLKPNASKIALWHLSKICLEGEIDLIDCQMETAYLKSMGGEEIPRTEYVKVLKQGLILPSTTWKKEWNFMSAPER